MEIAAAVGSMIVAASASAGSAVAASAAAHPVLFAVGAASALAGAGTAITSGVQGAQAAASQRRQAELQIQAERTQAALENEARQRQLRQVLATQNAIFGGSNVSLSSGTPSVIAGETMAEVDRQQAQSMLFSGARQSIFSMQASDAARSGRYAMINGFLGAGKSLLDFAVPMVANGKMPSMGYQSKPVAALAGPASGGLA